MAKTLVLIRHGHRDLSRKELDNGLSEKGRGQARSLRRFFSSRFKDQEFKNGLWLVSSPKVRCVETVEPFAKALGRTVDRHPGLTEKGARESLPDFEERVHAFLKEWRESNVDLTVLCSHGDWIPVAIFHLLGLDQDVKKGSWFELELASGRFALKWYIPSFKALFS